jgi:dolichol-phosphate mannosyltransferase
MEIRVLDTARMLKFILVGLSGLLVNTGVLYLGHEVGRLPLILASALAVETAIVNNFLWNNTWTYAQRGFALSKFLKFNLVSLGGLVLTVGMLYGFVNWFGWHYLLANALAVSVSTAWNFMANSLWTWSTSTA